MRILYSHCQLIRDFVAILCSLCLLAPAANCASAGDWPQILGPNRNGQATDAALEPWSTDPADFDPESSVRTRWRFSCGGGYAGVAVQDSRVFVWHRISDREQLDCLSAKDGKSLWKTSFPTKYRGGIDPDTGPRCVPVVQGSIVLAYGAGGDLHAVSVADGKEIWSRSLRSDYDAEEGYFGAGSTPLVLEDRAIVAVGGRTKAGLVAVRLSDGKTIWTSLDSEASYASPTTISIAGKELVLAVMRLKAYVVDPDSGNVVNEIPFGQRGPTVNAATPLVQGSIAFLTASYGIGCRKVDLAQPTPKNLWADDEVISSQYVTPVIVGDYLFAISGREDMRNGGLVCVAWSDGELQWSRPDYGTAHPIAIGNQVLLQGLNGRVELIQADATAYKLLAATQLPAGTYRSLPAYSQGLLLSRRTISAQAGEIVATLLNEN